MINFKLKSFPHYSETFISSNIIYAIEHSYQIRIITDKFLGINNSSQAKVLNKLNINEKVIKPIRFSFNPFLKLFQVAKMLSNLRIFRYYIIYCITKKTINLKYLNTLYQFKDTKSGVFHVHFNNALDQMIDIASMGYIKPKCIVTFHGYDAFLNSSKTFQSKYSVFYKNYVFKVTVNSNYLKNRLIELGIESRIIDVIPVGIDTKFFKSAPKVIQKDAKLKLITVGRLVQLKGQNYAIKAVKQLSDLGIKVELKIIGEGPKRNYLTELTKKYGLEDIVKFYGKLSQHKIRDHLDSSHIFLMPSTYDDTTKRKEAFGLVSVEAQSMGLPVIGFKSGGFPETIIDKKTGFLVKDRDADAIVERIIYLLKNPRIHNIMSYNAIKYSKKFDLKNTYQKYLDLYEKIY